MVARLGLIGEARKAGISAEEPRLIHSTAITVKNAIETVRQKLMSCRANADCGLATSKRHDGRPLDGEPENGGTNIVSECYKTIILAS
jgi:hypothetical protein